MARLQSVLTDETLLRKTSGLDEVKVANFNAWTAEADDVLEGLIKTVLQAMDPNVLRQTLRKERVVGVVKVGVLFLAGWLRVGALVNEAWDRMSVDARDEERGKRSRHQGDDEIWLGEQEGRVPEVPPRKLLVVFVDDLDRCSPENVLKVFEGLKLYLDARGFVFVIGYDEGVLTQSVADKKRFANISKGRDYIEKIVQIVFRIPLPTNREVENLLATYMHDSRTTELFRQPDEPKPTAGEPTDTSLRTLVIERNDRNPRRIKRFINRFILDHLLDQGSRGMKPELLVKLLIFETYYPQFTSKFTEVGEGENPIEGFLQFDAAREALRGGNQSDPAVSEVFKAYKIPLPPTAEAALDLLNKEADERFVPLVGDGSFVSLVRSIPNPQDQQQILEKVRRRKELGTTAPSTVAVKSGPAPDVSTSAATADLARQSILWIDSHPENIEGLATRMREAGADVAIASDLTTAEQVLQTFKPHLLISDVGSAGGPSDVGFTRLEQLRGKDLYSGPVIFYTTRLSAGRREQATKLGAAIVSGEDDLFKELATVFPSEPPPREEPAAPIAS